MKCACGTSLSNVLVMVALVGFGAAGYNAIRTGCPLGTCAQPATPLSVTTPAGGAAVTSAGMLSPDMGNDSSGLSCCERKARGEKQDCCPDEPETPAADHVPATDAPSPAPMPDKPAA